MPSAVCLRNRRGGRHHNCWGSEHLYMPVCAYAVSDVVHLLPRSSQHVCRGRKDPMRIIASTLGQIPTNITYSANAVAFAELPTGRRFHGRTFSERTLSIRSLNIQLSNNSYSLISFERKNRDWSRHKKFAERSLCATTVLFLKTHINT